MHPWLFSDNAYACDPRIQKFKEEEKEKKLAQKRAKQEAARQRAEEEEKVRRWGGGGGGGEAQSSNCQCVNRDCEGCLWILLSDSIPAHL